MYSLLIAASLLSPPPELAGKPIDLTEVMDRADMFLAACPLVMQPLSATDEAKYKALSADERLVIDNVAISLTATCGALIQGVSTTLALADGTVGQRHVCVSPDDTGFTIMEKVRAYAAKNTIALASMSAPALLRQSLTSNSPCK